ncbi:hypothetical protein B0T13DRAFT_63990 [Neurospora crassa]|nr:hypothetical protein B0T13DRAFT_63990 [Neurospora crassa]
MTSGKPRRLPHASSLSTFNACTPFRSFVWCVVCGVWCVVCADGLTMLTLTLPPQRLRPARMLGGTATGWWGGGLAGWLAGWADVSSRYGRNPSF